MAFGDPIRKLFTPIRINHLELRNRIVMPAMHLGYTPGGLVSDRLIDFYGERAIGGVGLIIIGGCTIDEFGGMSEMIGLHDDRFVEGLSRLARSVQGEGAKIFAQLYQAGRYAYSLITGRPALAPSAIASKLTRETPKAMELDDIRLVQESFVKAALRAQAAGLDGVEVLGSAGYLISQFLSPVTNRREDDYGGSWEHRTRFGREVMEQVRQAVGPDFPVMVRIAGNDFMPGGNTNREAALFARIMVEAGADAVNVTGGWHETRVPQLTMMVPQGAFSYLARGVKEAVPVPVVACNRINDPLLADQILRQGQADLIGIARGLITDPDLPRKAMGGNLEAIQHCIGCNQGCFDEVFKLLPVTCLVNPRAGREKETRITRASSPKKVVVIGGGPAGLMAAFTAARRGHRVSLYDRNPELGGQAALAALPPGRREMASLIRDLIYQLGLVDVEMHSDQEVSSTLLEDLAPDAVVVATGALPVTPEIPGVNLPNVVGAWEVLTGRTDAESPVVIIGGGAVGCETALFLARQGTITPDTLYFLFENQAEQPETLYPLITRGIKDVTIVEMMGKIGRDIGASTRWSIVQDLTRRGIRELVSAKAIEITSEAVIVEQGGRTISLPARTVVLAVGVAPVNDLYAEIKDQFPEVYLIGDAQRPRKALEAVREGLEVGLRI